LPDEVHGSSCGKIMKLIDLARRILEQEFPFKFTFENEIEQAIAEAKLMERKAKMWDYHYKNPDLVLEELEKAKEFTAREIAGIKPNA
jgi:hypothetical protein